MSKVEVISDMLTGEEVQEAIVRFVLARKLKDTNPDDFLRTAQVHVSYKNIRFPDGGLSLFASVTFMTPAKEEGRKAIDTPVPTEKADG